MIQKFKVELTAYVSMDSDWRKELVTVYAHNNDDAQKRALDSLQKLAPTIHRSLWKLLSVEKIVPIHRGVMI